MKKLLNNSFILLIFIFTVIFQNQISIVIDNISNFFFVTKNEEEVDNSAKILENTGLRKELNKLTNLNMENYLSFNYQIGRLVNEDLYEAVNHATLLLGYNNGIKKDMILMNNYGLVGIIKDVQKRTSTVELITSNNSFSIKINNNYGIVSTYDEVNNHFVIKKIDDYASVGVGDIVKTSGLGKYPEDIIVGIVKSIHQDKDTLIYVTPTIDVKNINYVIVLGAKAV